MTVKNISGALLPLLLIQTLLLLGGCSDDISRYDDPPVEEGIPVEIPLSVGILRSGVESGETSADGTPADPISDDDKINSWWIAFVDHNGVVRQIIDRTATGAVEMETFRCAVAPGVYDLYAFANVTPNGLKAATGVEFKTGEKIALPTGITKIDDAVWSVSLNGHSGPLPMSGILREVRVKAGIEETFSVEVVRMVAKVEFLFMNPGTTDITVNGISIDPVTTSGISLFPRGETGISLSHLGNSPYTPLAGAEYGKASFILSSGNVVKAGEEKGLSKSVFIQESLSDYKNGGAFTIGIKVTHAGGVSDYEQYNITRDILTYINRNDHIRIPVTLSRYDVDLDAVFYPPIGGYPAAASSVDPDGSQVFTFLTEGDFAIVPHVIDKLTGHHIAPVYYKVEVRGISDPSGIFPTATPPSVQPGSPALPDEVTGILTNATGRATVEVTVYIYDKPRHETGAKVTDRYTRTLYIIRE